MMYDYSLGLYEKSMPHSMTLREKLGKVSASGFDFLEVSIDETDEKLARLNWNLAERREIIDAILDTGTAIGSMCLSGHRKYPLGSVDSAVRQKSVDIMARAIDLACDWGIRLIQLMGYDVYYEQSSEQTLSYFRENLAKCVEMAARAGVVLAFETMETPFMDTVEKAMAHVSEINSPYLQVYPDLGNLTNSAALYGHSAARDIEAGNGHIAALHLKETLPGKYRDIPYGTGHVDFVAGIKAARGVGVRRFVAELWDNGEFEAQLIHAHAFLRGFLGSCCP